MASRKVSEKKNLETKITGLEAQLKRALADYDNLQKRVISQKEMLTKLIKAEVWDKLITVLDDLERAENHLKDHGLSLALGQFRQVLASEGIKEVEVSQKIFDPQKMDCVCMISGPKNRVINIVQKGYEIDGLVIRPVKVEVGSGEKIKNQPKIENKK